MLEDEEMKDFKEVFINPTIESETGDSWEFEEGCLSIPGVRVVFQESPKFKLRILMRNGTKKLRSTMV